MIYLDNAATTEPKFFRKTYQDFWKNSNSPYAVRERDCIYDCEKRIMKHLNVNNGVVLFFRSATDAIEWLHKEIMETNIFWFDCPKYSHDSVYNLIDNYIKEDNTYGVFVEQLINPVTGAWMASALHSIPHGFVGCDYTAAIGHVQLPQSPTVYYPFDFIFFSGHKFHVEKGIAAMWINKRLFHLLGGSKDLRNQHNLVHGTVDVPAILALTAGLDHAIEEQEWCSKHHGYLMDVLLHELAKLDVKANMLQGNTWSIKAIHLPGINADALQTYLAFNGIYIGVAHSACAGEGDYRVMKALGYTEEVARQTIRVSFCEDTVDFEVKELARRIKDFKEVYC